MRNAMEYCMQFKPEDRPTSRAVARILTEAYQKISQDKKQQQQHLEGPPEVFFVV